MLIDGASWPVLVYLQDRARFVGAEGYAEWVPRRHVVLGVRGDVLRATRAGGTPVPFIPPARLGLSARRDDGRLSFGGGLRHGFRRHRTGLEYEVPTGAFTLVDLDAGVRLVHSGRVHSLTLRADNALDALYLDATRRIKDFAPNPGRNLSLLSRVYC